MIPKRAKHRKAPVLLCSDGFGGSKLKYNKVSPQLLSLLSLFILTSPLTGKTPLLQSRFITCAILIYIILTGLLVVWVKQVKVYTGFLWTVQTLQREVGSNWIIESLVYGWVRSHERLISLPEAKTLLELVWLVFQEGNVLRVFVLFVLFWGFRLIKPQELCRMSTEGRCFLSERHWSLRTALYSDENKRDHLWSVRGETEKAVLRTDVPLGEVCFTVPIYSLWVYFNFIMQSRAYIKVP